MRPLVDLDVQDGIDSLGDVESTGDKVRLIETSNIGSFALILTHRGEVCGNIIRFIVGSGRHPL